MALEWSDSEPAITVVETEGGVSALIDPRLSDQQVRAACAQLDGVGAAVLQQWQALVGATAEGGLAT